MKRSTANPYRRTTRQEQRPLRVGFITPCLYHGGAERWIYSLSRHWPMTVQTTVILCQQGAIATRPQAERLARVIEWTPQTAAARCKAFLESADVALAWGEERLGMLASHLPIPIVAVSHGAAHYDFSRMVCRGMEPHADHLAAVSEEAALAFAGATAATVIHNGAEADRCVPLRGGDALRKELGIPAWAPVMLFAGRVSAEKHPEVARAALDHLPAYWHLIIAGASAGFTVAPHPRCHVTGPYAHPGDLLDAATVFVCPSESEAHCISLNEAWIAGVPAVTTHWPVLDELTRGADVRPVTLPHGSDPKQWALAVEYAAGTNPEPLRRLALRRYAAPAMAHRWAGYLLRVANVSSPRQPSPTIPNPYANPYPYP
jgi:glycosyltransferase involved in cell wall biosynthesis